MSRLLSASEAAKLLGFRKEALLKLLDSGEIPAVRQGNRWKIDEGQLQEWFTAKALREAKARREISNG